mmetsp:Transcript_1168/g.3982  ORF Transcript_1168/g.3982 Transcript_1168/m.3982 type:complete len:204 (-) Transcript_1168:654-1265(-)
MRSLPSERRPGSSRGCGGGKAVVGGLGSLALDHKDRERREGGHPSKYHASDRTAAERWLERPRVPSEIAGQGVPCCRQYGSPPASIAPERQPLCAETTTRIPSVITRGGHWTTRRCGRVGGGGGATHSTTRHADAVAENILTTAPRCRRRCATASANAALFSTFSTVGAVPPRRRCNQPRRGRRWWWRWQTTRPTTRPRRRTA